MRGDVNYFISLGIVNNEPLTIKLFLHKILHHIYSIYSEWQKNKTNSNLIFSAFHIVFANIYYISYILSYRLFKNMPLRENLKIRYYQILQ